MPPVGAPFRDPPAGPCVSDRDRPASGSMTRASAWTLRRLRRCRLAPEATGVARASRHRGSSL